MNSRDENEGNEKINFFDDAEESVDEKDDLFGSRNSVDVHNYKDDKNDKNYEDEKDQEFFRGLDREEFDFFKDDDPNLHNFGNIQPANPNRKSPSLNNEFDNYDKLDVSSDEKHYLQNRNKRTMTFSDLNLFDNSEIDNSGIDKLEIPEELGRLYVKADWKLIYDELKAKGYTLRKINNEIGSNFRNNLYADRSMRLTSFEKLQNIVDFNINYTLKDIDTNYQKFKFPKDKNLAEMFGIILGDGHIGKNDQEVKISLNPIKEPEYVSHVSGLFEKTLQVKPGRYSPPGKEEDIKLYSGRKGISKELQELGLIPGNKVENQVDVPNWIKENNEFKISCIRGLFDTDGSTYFQERKHLGIKYVQNKFSNKSIPLLDFFENFCTENNINTSRTGDDVLIQSRKGVTDFYDIVKPHKMKNFLKNNNLNREDLGHSLHID